MVLAQGSSGFKAIGIWIRVSTEDQVRGESPEHHEKRARHYAEAKGWNVREVYRLEAVSGKSVMEHPEAKRMLADIKSGHITGLIFSKLARLARNTRELLDFSDIFRGYNADLISLQESIDTSSPAGRLFYTMIAAMAQWEREEIAERVAVSVPIRAKLGKPLGGQAPFGYQWHENKLVPHPEEAPVRKLIYELFLKHRRKKTVARILNEKGYRTRNSSPFSDTTVDRLLRDPTAKGIRRANYTKSTGSKKRWQLKPESEWVLSAVEPIVAEDLWNECNAILDSQRANNKRPAKKTVYLFAGFVHCSCGHKMYVPANTPKYVCYKCRSKIPVTDLDALFHEQLKSFFFSPDEIAGQLKHADEALGEKENLITSLERERRKITAEMDKLYNLYQADSITKEGFGARYHPLADRQKQIENELPRLQAELDLMKISHLSREEIITEARDLYSRWKDLPPDDKRHIVETITERIVVGKDEVSINLLYLPPFLDADRMATRHHGRVAFFPFTPMCLKALRPLPYAREPKTLGEHLKKRRCELSLRQKDVAGKLEIGHSTYITWETGQAEPEIRYWPKIIEFLGLDPLVNGGCSLGERLQAKYRELGIPRKRAAILLGIDEGTLLRYERGKWEPGKRNREIIERFLNSEPHRT